MNHHEYSEGKYSYECNVEKLCLWTRYGKDYWNFKQSKQLIEKHDPTKYPDLKKIEKRKDRPDNIKLRETYLDMQNNIMNCAVLKSKYALNVKILDDYKMSERSKEILRDANKKLDEEIDNEKCLKHNKNDKIYNYKDLLDSLSYETCIYSMYMHYYQSLLEKEVGIAKDVDWIRVNRDLAEIKNTEFIKVEQEVDLVRKTMETALTFYETFEKTYIAHVLLEVIEVELTEYKRYIGGIVRVIQQFVTLLNNAQVHPDKR